MSAVARAVKTIQPLLSASQKKLNQLTCFCAKDSDVLQVSKIAFPSYVEVSTSKLPSSGTDKGDSLFDIPSFCETLKTKKLGSVFMYGDEVTSTQTILTEYRHHHVSASTSFLLVQ